MEIPKRIIHIIERRMKAAYTFSEMDMELGEWLTKKGIEVEPCDVFGGVEAIVNPSDSAERIIEAIKAHNPKNEDKG